MFLTHLHISHVAVSSVDKGANFELLEPDTKNPIPRGPAERSEAVPTRHWLPDIFWRHFWAGYILVDVHGLVTVVPLHFGCGIKQTQMR